ncbi:MAG TPA: flagellar motor protein MotB, partial [Bdellovibrionota bacterium]|nr:flagellar motor protein MotB [Bdellovibrionota bacterium]
MALTGLLKKRDRGEQKVVPRKSDPPVRHNDGNHDEANWLVSYADMMTLLCGFFVMLFSFANMDAARYEKAKEEISKQFKGTYISPQAEVKGFVTETLLAAGVTKNVIVKSDPTGVSIIFESVLFFDTLSAEVKAEGADVLNRLIQRLKLQQEKSGKKYRIVVEGHTDSRPITGGTFPSNWELSSSRASGVVRMFLNQGYAADRLIAIGYADTRPRVPPRKADGSLDEEAFGKNRRVVLRIMEPGMEVIPLPELEKA